MPTSPGPAGAGVTYRQTRAIPRRSQENLPITVFQPPTRLAVQAQLGPFRATASYLLEPVPSSRREVARHAEFMAISEQIAEVNEKICEARPVAGADALTAAENEKGGSSRRSPREGPRDRKAGDGGCPVAGRDGKGEDRRARAREVKLAVFFTQDQLDKDGYPVRDPGSSSYIATFEPAAVFADLVKAEGIRRGADHVRQLTILGDGAAWICYPDVGIADLIPVPRLSRGA